MDKTRRQNQPIYAISVQVMSEKRGAASEMVCAGDLIRLEPSEAVLIATGGSSEPLFAASTEPLRAAVPCQKSGSLRVPGSSPPSACSLRFLLLTSFSLLVSATTRLYTCLPAPTSVLPFFFRFVLLLFQHVHVIILDCLPRRACALHLPRAQADVLDSYCTL